MKKITMSVLALALLVLCQTAYAQEDYDIYLQKARQRLEEGDCDAAQRNYDVYVQLTKKTNVELEKGIQDCKSPTNAINSIEPFTINYVFKKDSYIIGKENMESQRTLLEKIDSGAPIVGFRIDVWVGPDVSEERASALAANYANAVEQDIKRLLARCNMPSDAYLFETRVHAVDRDTFLFFVENTDLKDKYAIMSALNNSDEFENTLEWLLSVYPDFEKEIMPLLRKVQVYVF